MTIFSSFGFLIAIFEYIIGSKKISKKEIIKERVIDDNIINGDIAKYLDSGDMDKLRDSISINTASGKYNEGLEARRKRERELFSS